MAIENIRTIKAVGGDAALMVDQTEATLTAGTGAAVYVGKNQGVSVNGNAFCLNTSPMAMQFASMAVLNPLSLLGIPSTFATPIPTFIFNLPGTGTLTQMAIMTGVMMTFYAGTTAAVGAVG